MAEEIIPSSTPCSRFQARNGKRLHWRVTVQSASPQDGSRGGPKMTWHLVE